MSDDHFNEQPRYPQRAEPLSEPESWWLRYQSDRAGFYEMAQTRLPTLALKFGCGPVSTIPGEAYVNIRPKER